MDNRKVRTAPVQSKHPKNPTHRKPGDFEPEGATKTPPIIEGPPHTSAKPKSQNNDVKEHR